MAEMPLWVVLLLWTSVLIAMAFGDTMFFGSLEHLGVTRALTLSMANPMLTTVVGILLLGEAMTLPRAGGILMVVGGLTLIIAGKGEGGADVRKATRRGLRLVLLAAGAWALSAILLKPALQAVSVLPAAAVRIPMAGLVLCLTPWPRGTLTAIRQADPAERTRLAAICALSALGTLCFTVGIKYGGVAVGNVLASTSPLFTLPFEVWVLGQPLSGKAALGATTTMMGIGLMNL